MKNLTLVGAATVMVMALGSTAGAQAESWTGENGVFNFQGCFGVQAGVQCNYTYTFTKLQTGVVAGDGSGIVYYLADGTTHDAQSLSIGGGNFSYYPNSVNAVSGIPVKIAFTLNIPKNTQAIAALVIFGHRINNVYVSQTGAPAAPPTAATTRPAATPVPAPTIGTVNVTMSGCTAAGGVITCTKAVITPK